MKNIAWFSSGVSSAVAIKLAIKEIDEIIYEHIDDQHLDSLRFLKDCEQWFSKKITILQSDFKNVENVIRHTRYINGPSGAPCTRLLKREVRKEWEEGKGELCYFWGLDAAENKRCEGIIKAMPDQKHRFPLIEQNIDKEMAHGLLEKEGIKRPKMYEMGFKNNNCIGCVKGGKGYWNLIRKHFPDVFQRRALLEREIGASCINGTYLDELSEESGHVPEKIATECDILCELKHLNNLS